MRKKILSKYQNLKREKNTLKHFFELLLLYMNRKKNE